MTSLFVLSMLVGCASSNARDPSDAGPVPIDAAPPGPPDATSSPDAAAPRPGAEVVTAAGRVTAGSVTIDVSIGHAMDQRDATAGTRRLSGATVVYP